MQPTEPMTVEEVAKYFRVTEETVRNWIRSGELEAIDVGNSYRIFLDQLEEFKERRRTRRRKQKEDEPK